MQPSQATQTSMSRVSRIEARVMAGAWDVTDSGIMFVVGRANPPAASPAPDVLAVYDFAERGVTRLGELRFRVAPFGSPRYLAVSPDRRWTLASHVDNWNRDIMVVDNFIDDGLGCATLGNRCARQPAPHVAQGLALLTQRGQT